MDIYFSGLILRAIDTIGISLVTIQELRKIGTNMEETQCVYKRVSHICYILDILKDQHASVECNAALNGILQVGSSLNTFLFEIKEKGIIFSAPQYKVYLERLEGHLQSIDEAITTLNESQITSSQVSSENELKNEKDVCLETLTCTRNSIIEKSKPVTITYLNDVHIDTNAKCGEGSFGKVYVGEYKGTRVAIKVLNNVPFEDPRQATISTDAVELSKMVLRELRAFEKLQKCPYVVKFYGATSIDGILGIVTDYLDNHSLSHWLYIDENNAINDKLNKIAIGVAQGLSYLHRHGMSHNDVKSANIMLDRLYEPRLIDFGMVRLNNGSTLSMNTMEHTGTAQWRAPEYWEMHHQARQARKQFLFAGDVFSFAVVLGELVTKELPWDKCGKEEIKEAVLSTLRPYCFQGPIFDIMQLCWTQDPKDRISMQDIFERLCHLKLGSFSMILHKEMNSFSHFALSVSNVTSPVHNDINSSDIIITNITESPDMFIGQWIHKKIIIKKFIVPLNKNVLKYKIKHLNLCELYGMVENQLIFELVPNGSLNYWLYYQHDYKFSFEEKVIILRDISDALSFLHKHNLFHGRLHPKNIMFDYDFNVKLTNFCTSSISEKPLHIGYKSKEIIETKNYIQYDVYSVALLCGELFTNRPPFRNLSEEQINAMLSINAKPYVEQDVPKEIRTILVEGLDGEKDLKMIDIHKQLKMIIDFIYRAPVDVIVTNGESRDNLLLVGDRYVENGDYRNAYDAYRQSADLNCPEASFNLAKLYQKGLGSKKNLKEAIFWFEKSANLGCKDAMFALGTIFKYGTLLQLPNKEKAREWYLKASNNGHIEATYQLGKLSDKVTQKELFLKAASQGHEKSLKRINSVQ